VPEFQTLLCPSPVGYAPLGRRMRRPTPGQDGAPGDRQRTSAGWQWRSRGAAARGHRERLLKRRHFLRGGLVLEELIKQLSAVRQRARPLHKQRRGFWSWMARPSIDERQNRACLRRCRLSQPRRHVVPQSPTLRKTRIVGSKSPLFAGSRVAVCGPLQLALFGISPSAPNGQRKGLHH
jgi:hypothetical protein